MILTSKQATQLAYALFESACRVEEKKQKQFIVFCKDTFTAIPFDEKMSVEQEDFLVF